MVVNKVEKWGNEIFRVVGAGVGFVFPTWMVSVEVAKPKHVVFWLRECYLEVVSEVAIKCV